MNSKIERDPYRHKDKKGSKTGYKILLVILVIAAIILGHVRLDIPVETLAQEYANEQSRFVEVDGLNVHYRDEGEGEPLVLIHGWSASLHTWDVWTEKLKEDFRIIRMDLPAFGLTGPAADADYSIDYYVDFLDHFLTALDVEESFIAGNSLGGGITWLYAAKHPEKVKKIVLLDAAGYDAEMPSITKLAQPEIVRSTIRYITPRYAIRLLVNQVFGDKERVTDETVERYYRLLLREGNREVMFKVLDRIQDRENEEVTQLLNGVTIPALIMWGEKDAWIPLDAAYKFEQDLPDARLITYDDAGHIPMEEIPENTAHDARSFLLEN